MRIALALAAAALMAGSGFREAEPRPGEGQRRKPTPRRVAPASPVTNGDLARIEAAEAKRARKAAKLRGAV